MTTLLRKRRDERGSTLLLTLVFMALFGVLVSALLAFGDVNLNLNEAQESNTNRLYATDGAIEWATQQKLANNASCPTALKTGKTLTGTEMQLPADVANVVVGGAPTEHRVWMEAATGAGDWSRTPAITLAFTDQAPSACLQAGVLP